MAKEESIEQSGKKLHFVNPFFKTSCLNETLSALFIYRIPQMRYLTDDMKLAIRLIPNSKKSELVGWEGKTLKIRIAAPPIEGKANEALVKFLADILDCTPSEIDILKGTTSKNKLLEVPRLPEMDS